MKYDELSERRKRIIDKDVYFNREYTIGKLKLKPNPRNFDFHQGPLDDIKDKIYEWCLND